jgi:VWFA-related protein
VTRPLIIVLLAFGLAPGVPGQDDSGETHDSGLTVEVGVSRLFLDVEVVDTDGRPMPGLTQEDFTIRLNNREYPIYSVDDLCGCAGGDGPPGPSPNFILFFDFSQIGSRWRETALREAERWANEVKRPEERAMVVAYATPSGLRTLCRLTDDPEKLVASIRDARADPGIDDPFPDRHTQRFENCVDGTVSCHNSGMREYRQTFRSSEVLTRFLMRMGSLPGRKEMLLFYQNNAIYPGCLFATDDSCDAFHDSTSADSVPGLDDIVGEVAGTAVASGTVIYPILSGPATDWSVDFGETLAGITGGRFNHDSGGIGEVVNAAGRDCACMYRIGVQPPPSSSSRVLRVKVAVRDGEWLPHDYRLLQLTEQERWRRNAEAVLLDPESAREIALSAAVVPVAATRRRWDAKVLVTLDPRSLGLLPSGERSVASWEIGAVLVRRGA